MLPMLLLLLLLSVDARCMMMESHMKKSELSKHTAVSTMHSNKQLPRFGRRRIGKVLCSAARDDGRRKSPKKMSDEMR